MIGIFGMESGHHLFKGALVVGYPVRSRKGIGDAHRSQMFLQFGHEDIAQGHGGGADLGPHHLEAPTDLARGAGHAFVVQMRREITVFSQSRDHGHEVRFTGAIVAYDQQSFIIHWLVELKLRNNQIDQFLGHLLGDDIGLDKLPGGCSFVSIPQLDNRFNGFKLNQISVSHHLCLPALSFLTFMAWSPTGQSEYLGWDIVCILDGQALRRSDYLLEHSRTSC
ncbi:MAG: hypothetical protein BWY83_01619 [bacterium ADurb.Bin478]|nr:MAG: hypothetical protein BWY83_01619 [bacterium ADurb.Bin478]